MDFTTYEFFPGFNTEGLPNVHVLHELCGYVIYEDGESVTLSVAMGAATRHNVRCPRLMSEAAKLALARA